MDTQSDKKWTVMVYLAGNNDLDEEMVASLQGMSKHAGNKKSNIFAYYASANPLREVSLYDFRDKNGDDIENYRVPDPKKFCGDCGDLGGAAKPETLVNFVKCCHHHSDTPHNVLILSGHSDAFIGRSLLKDESALQVMSFLELAKALKEITGHVLKGKLDILGFDSCAMCMIETAYELRDTAQVLVSPQDFTPSGG